jgi:hypothetical protein
MIRSLGIIIFLFFSVLFLPFWFQAILYILAILTIRHKVLVLLPAVFSDIWYAPYEDFTFSNLKTTIFVLVALGIYLLIIKNTRLLQNNGLEKKK